VLRRRPRNLGPHLLPAALGPPVKDLADILATTLTLPGDVQLRFDARRRTDPAGTVRGRFFLLLDVGDPVLLGEVVYAVAFLTQAHDYLRRAYFGQDAEQLLNRLADAEPDLQNLSFPIGSFTRPGVGAINKSP
jgi:hypothetical protein